MGGKRAVATGVARRCKTGPAGAARIAWEARTCRAAVVEGMPSEVVPGEDTTEPMLARAAVAVAPAWEDLEAAPGEAAFVLAAGGVAAAGGGADERRKLPKRKSAGRDVIGAEHGYEIYMG